MESAAISIPSEVVKSLPADRLDTRVGERVVPPGLRELVSRDQELGGGWIQCKGKLVGMRKQK